MSRLRQISTIVIAAAMVMLLQPAEAQQKTVKEQLIGTWTLVSADFTDSAGTKLPLVKGSPIKGLQIFTADGRVSFQVIGDHPKVASNDRQKMTAEEMKSTAESILSYFGTYTVDESEKSYTLRIESSSFANQTANPSKRLVEINGDDMKVTNPGRIAGGQTLMVWRRVK